MLSLVCIMLSVVRKMFSLVHMIVVSSVYSVVSTHTPGVITALLQLQTVLDWCLSEDKKKIADVRVLKDIVLEWRIWYK